MALQSRQIRVSDVPSHLDADYLTLILESKKDCPDGGDVESVDLDSEARTAMVTFTDSSVAARLLSAGHVIVQDTSLIVTRAEQKKNRLGKKSECLMEKSRPAVLPKPPNSNLTNVENIPPLLFQKAPSFSTNEARRAPPAVLPKPQTSAMELKSAGDNSEFTLSSNSRKSANSNSRLELGSVGIDTVRNKDMKPSSSPRASNSDDIDDSGDVRRDESADFFSYACCSAVEEVVSKSSAACSFENRNEFPAKVYDQLQSMPSVSTQQCKKAVDLDVSRLQLIQKLIQAKRLEFKCSVDFDISKPVVVLTGSRQDVDSAEEKIWLCVVRSCTKSLSLSVGLIKLLSTTDGKLWLDKQFAESKLSVSACVVGGKLQLLAEDDQTVDEASSFVDNLLLSKTIKVQDCHQDFLKSVTWHSAISKYQTTACLAVNVDDQKKEVVVEGNAVDVNCAYDGIVLLLREHSRVVRPIGLSLAQYRVLKAHYADIQEKVDCLPRRSSSAVLVRFTETATNRTLEISGQYDEVNAAENYLRVNYLSVLCVDKLELDLPGITRSDFAKAKSDENEIIVSLECRYKCSIEVDSVIVTGRQQLMGGKSERVSLSPPPATAAVSLPLPNESVSDETNVSVGESCIEVVGAQIEFMKVDVVVNVIASQQPDLSKASRVSTAIAKAAGPKMQQEINGKPWPKAFGDIVETSGYNLSAKKVYHAAVHVCGDDSSIKLLRKVIEQCLMTATTDGFSSIAFPTIGCGKLGYTPRNVASCFRRAVRLVGRSMKVYIVSVDDNTRQQFLSHLRSESPSLSTRSNYPAPSARSGHRPTFTGNDVDLGVTRRSSASVSRHAGTDIIVTVGDLATYKADAVVNIIADRKTNLSRASQVSAAIVKVAGPELQEEIDQFQWPMEMGRDVIATQAYGGMQCTKVYHAAMGRFRNSTSVQLLEKMIALCIDEAERDNLSSIAFPLIGSGKLNYDPQLVGQTFVKVKTSTNTRLEIHIVAHVNDDKLARFKASLSAGHSTRADEPTDQLFEMGVSRGEESRISKFFRGFHMRSRRAEYSSSRLHKPVAPPPPATAATTAMVSFFITAIDRRTVDDVKEKLALKVSGLVDSKELRHDGVRMLLSTSEAKIKSTTQAVAVSVTIDKNANVIKLRGRKEHVAAVEKLVLKILQEETADLTKHAEVPRESINDRLRRIGTQETCPYPPYWESVKKNCVGEMAEPKRCPLLSSAPVYKEVLQLINETFEPNRVGKGFDAQGLKHSKIVVQNMWTIENPYLYRQYWEHKKRLCLQSSVNGPLQSMVALKEREIWTQQVCRDKKLTTLHGNVIPQINEHYLLHGTKSNAVDFIKEGFDFRQTSEKLLFGKGVYFAECTTKADQHTDDRTQRPCLGTPLFMYVARVVLGNTFVCSKPEQFCKPPCTNCLSDKCVDPGHGHRFFDSVTGTHSPSGNRLQFREFIIYEKTSCYPEFVVQYIRQ